MRIEPFRIEVPDTVLEDLRRACSPHAGLTTASRAFHSAARLYLEGRSAPLRFARGERLRVPCGIVWFAQESPFPPRSFIERGYRVERFTEVPRGGHFAALEEPERFVEDIREFFRPLREG